MNRFPFYCCLISAMSLSLPILVQEASACPPASKESVTHGMMMLTAEAQLAKPVCGSIVNTLRVEIKSADDHRVMVTVPEMEAGTSTGVSYLLKVTLYDLSNGSFIHVVNTFITFDDMGRWEKRADLLAFEDVVEGWHNAQAYASIPKQDGDRAQTSHYHGFTADPLAP